MKQGAAEACLGCFPSPEHRLDLTEWGHFVMILKGVGQKEEDTFVSFGNRLCIRFKAGI